MEKANTFWMLKSLVDNTSSYLIINYFTQYLEEAKKENYITEFFLYEDIICYIQSGIYNGYKHNNYEEDYEKAIILDEKQKTVLKLILIILCWAFWYYAEEYYSFNEYCFGTIKDSNACLDFLYEFKDWYAKEENYWDYDILKKSKTNPLYSEIVETIIDSYKEVMSNWKTSMRLKLKIDVPYQVYEKTYFVEKEIVVEQSFVNKKGNKFFEFSLDVDSRRDSLLHWWNAFYFGTTKATKKSDLEKFFLNLVDERFNLKKDED